MFESLHAILTENSAQRPGRVTVKYGEPAHPLHRMLLRRLRRTGVFESLAVDLERVGALGDLTIYVGTQGEGLRIDLDRFVRTLERALNQNQPVEQACFQAAAAMGTELARQVGEMLHGPVLQAA